MRFLILAAGAALTVSACGDSGETTANADMNAMAVDNMMVDENAAMTAPGGLDANAATNGEAEANMVMNDMTHNDADANLANGM